MITGGKNHAGKRKVKFLPAVILAIAAFIAIVGRARGSTEDLRLAGIGIPALAHMAAALALAISNNCSLSEKQKINLTFFRHNT